MKHTKNIPSIIRPSAPQIIRQIESPNSMLPLNLLKEKLYEKYNREQIGFIINVSKTHVSRLLTGKSKITLEQYLQLKNLL